MKTVYSWPLIACTQTNVYIYYNGEYDQIHNPLTTLDLVF